MIRGIIFDLDDTLHSEREYAFSGFAAVATAFADLLGDPDRAAADMRRLFDSPDRRRIFNALLTKRNLEENPKTIGRMIDAYRSHRPTISLYSDAEAALARFRSTHKLGLITDGPALQQWAKIDALSLRDRFDEIIVTDDLAATHSLDTIGESHSATIPRSQVSDPRAVSFAKPHPLAFELMSERLGVAPRECVYVADNPRKDFVAPNQLGWLTIRVRRPDCVYADATFALGGEPQRTIASLDDLETSEDLPRYSDRANLRGSATPPSAEAPSEPKSATPDKPRAMAEYACKPATAPFDATVNLPGSKSITNRALIAAALADGHSVLSNALLAEDTWIMVEALRALGIAVTVDEADRVMEVTGCSGHLPESEAVLFCGNSGTTIRFCAALVALSHGRYELDGIARMRQRPIGGLVAALQSLGSAVEYLGREGFPPIVVHARGLCGGDVHFESPESSQMVSSLLLAAPYARSEVLIEVTGHVPSAPYLRMTGDVMERFGVSVLCDEGGHHRAKPGVAAGRGLSLKFIVEAPQRYHGTTFVIEPDASNATYFLAAPAIAGGRVTIDGLGIDSIQGDVRFVDVLEEMGCRINREPRRLTVEGPVSPEKNPLRGIDVDLNDMPDTAQTLAVVALFARGTTTIRNVASLRIKETDRLAALARELRKFGADVEEFKDGLRIEGCIFEKGLADVDQGSAASDSQCGINSSSKPLPRTKGGQREGRSDSQRIVVDTYNDHRMAMSFALAGLRVPGVVINDPECVAKTFPDFFAVFDAIKGGATRS